MFFFHLNWCDSDWLKPWLVAIKKKIPDSATSSQGELLQLLPLKRTKKTVNWSKCLIWQSTNNKETLRKASMDGIKTFKEACSQQQDDVFEYLSSDIGFMSTVQVLWHSKCYQSYTSKQNLLFVKSATSTQRFPCRMQDFLAGCDKCIHHESWE